MATQRELTEARSQANFQEHVLRIRRSTSRVFLGLLLVQWPAGIAVALLVSPYTWRGADSMVHTHVWAATFLGFILTSVPAFLAWRHPTSPITMHTVAVAQALWSALLIHLTGGRIETHFHVFGSLAVLAFYRDWRVLMSAVVVTAADHFVRGVWWPESVFGTLGGTRYRWLEHAWWVLFESLFLVHMCRRSLVEMRGIARQQALLEITNERIETEVQERTTDLERAHRAAKAADHAKSMFLANMSHEIRTPMNSILGFTDLLNDPACPLEERQEHVATIRRNGEHLLSIINDILDISKIEAGKLKVEHIPTSVSQVIAEVVSLLRVRAIEKDLTLTVEYPTAIPESIVSDPVRLRQILMNLVGNALKFTREGGVTVSCTMKQTRHASALVIEVTDTGIGLTTEQRVGLFRSFAQADVSTTRKFGGSGLGLTISKRLAHKLGGDIEVDSEPNQGSTFRLVLKDVDVERVRMVQPDEASMATPDGTTATKPEDAAALTGRLLLAEDGPDNRRLVTAYLRKSGLSVDVAENGAIAVERWKDAEASGTPYSVILMDMQMPILDGYEATRRLRELGCTTPIVALTAHAMTESREACINAGCTEYLTKPIRRARLIATLAAVLTPSVEVQ